MGKSSLILVALFCIACLILEGVDDDRDGDGSSISIGSIPLGLTADTLGLVRGSGVGVEVNGRALSRFITLSKGILR